MIDRPWAHQRLGGAEEPIHVDQVAVAQNRLQRCDPGIGAQHEQAIVAGLLGQLAGIDLKRPCVRGGAQVAPVGGVADQGLVAPLQLLIESGDDGLAVGGILGRLSFVATDNVAPPLSFDLLDEELGLRAAGARDAQGREGQGVKGLSSASTTMRTRPSVRSRAPSTYSSPRSSRAAMVGAEIMPRSTTTQTRPIAKRLRRRSMTGTSTLTSAVLPGHISEQTGRPAASITTPTIICIRSGGWSLESPCSPRVSPPAPTNDSEVVSMNTTESSLNRSRRRSNSCSSTRSLTVRGAKGVAPAC